MQNLKEIKKKYPKAFTILELLIVITITGLLAGGILVTTTQGIARSRDARRNQELNQIGQALLIYYTTNNYFPTSTDAVNDPDCFIYGLQWDAGNKAIPGDEFIKPLIENDIIKQIPLERKGITINGRSCTYRYAKKQDPCGCIGNYAILYARCESNDCPTNERPSCCTDPAGYPDPSYTPNDDKSDIALFFKEK